MNVPPRGRGDGQSANKTWTHPLDSPLDKDLSNGRLRETLGEWRRGCPLTVKRIVLVSVVVFLAILPLIVRHYRGNSHAIEPERPRGIPIEEVLDAHDGRIKDRIDLLKKQTLDESFVELLEDQQYSSPGFHSPIKGESMQIESILSTRTFLKVFQEFAALPREQAVTKVKKFSERAAKQYGTLPPTGAAHYMNCVSMLLAARMREHKLILHLMDEMQRNHDERMARGEILPMPERAFGPLEDDAYLTILMYALKQAKMDIPIDESILIKKTIPLYRWDASLTNYDFAVWHGDGMPNPKDLVERFDVYAFPNDVAGAIVIYVPEPWFDNPKKKLFIDTLKECLSKGCVPVLLAFCPSPLPLGGTFIHGLEIGRGLNIVPSPSGRGATNVPSPSGRGLGRGLVEKPNNSGYSSPPLPNPLPQWGEGTLFCASPRGARGLC
jgi:hypothetical protein